MGGAKKMGGLGPGGVQEGKSTWSKTLSGGRLNQAGTRRMEEPGSRSPSTGGPNRSNPSHGSFLRQRGEGRPGEGLGAPLG
jgi:hypothetical protein